MFSQVPYFLIGTIKNDSNEGYCMTNSKENTNIISCPVADVQKIINGKWTMVIIYFLSQKTFRFGELSREIPQITQANLTKELRLLEKYGLIHREVYREVPPKVEYSLTDIGTKFLSIIEALEVWAVEYQEYKNEYL